MSDLRTAVLAGIEDLERTVEMKLTGEFYKVEVKHVEYEIYRYDEELDDLVSAGTGALTLE